VSQNDTAPESLGIPPELVVKLVAGEVTIAEMVGLSNDDLYEFAKQGHSLLKTGRLAEAERIFRGLVVASPYDSVFHTHLGAVLQAKDEVEEALEQFDLALQFNQKNVEALVGRGELRLKLKRTQEAIADLREAVAADPEAKKAATTRAKMMLHMLGTATLKRVAQAKAAMASKQGKAPAAPSAQAAKTAAPAAARPAAAPAAAKPAPTK